MYPDYNKYPRPNLVYSWENYRKSTTLQIKELQVYNKEMEIRFIQKPKQDIDTYDLVFAHFSRTTFLAQIYTVLEYNLRSICLMIEKHNHQKFSIYDLKGNSDLQKAKIYLEKTIEINVGQFVEWNIIKDCQRVRNCVVHDYCFFDAGSDLDKFIDRSKGFKIDTQSQDMSRNVIVKSFLLTDGAINKQFIDNIGGLFKSIYKQIIDFHLSVS